MEHPIDKANIFSNLLICWARYFIDPNNPTPIPRFLGIDNNYKSLKENWEIELAKRGLLYTSDAADE